MKNKWIYRSLLIGSFLLINLLLLNGFGKLWSYFNTGADRAGMMHPLLAAILMPLSSIATLAIAWLCLHPAAVIMNQKNVEL